MSAPHTGPMASPFWRFAKRMLRHRGTVALGAIGAVVSAAGLGAGLAAMAPLLNTILEDESSSLRALAQGDGSGSVRIALPEAIVESLPTDRFDSVLWMVLALGVLTIIGATGNFLHAYCAATLSTRAIAEVRRDAFRAVVHLPLVRVLAKGSSDMVSRIVNDSTRLNTGFLALVGKGPAQVTKGVAAFIAALVIDFRVLAVLPAGIVLGIIIRKLGKRVKRAARGVMQAQSELLGASTEVMQGLRVVKVYTSERAEVGRFSRHNRRFVEQELRARTARALSSPLLEAVSILVLGSLALIAAKLIIDGDLAAPTFIAALAALGVAAASMKPLSGIVQDVQAASPAAIRLDELIGGEREGGHAPLATRLPRHAESIEFENVRFTYPGASEPALRGVSLRIEHGQTVAFVGGNGSGKTTLLSLVPRLFDPDSGRVRIDGCDITEAHLRSLRRQIGVVTQEVVLFEGAIASNIAYANPGATREQIEGAARLAGADDFIRAKPGGYDAQVGEQGVSLSGGQRQRIAIARAILRDPAILLLDEATSMIDADSEAQISEALGAFSRGRTTLVIAHRLSTVVNADRIVVMQDGRISDAGSHAELLERSPHYRSLTANQLVSAPA